MKPRSTHSAHCARLPSVPASPAPSLEYPVRLQPSVARCARWLGRNEQRPAGTFPVGPARRGSRGQSLAPPLQASDVVGIAADLLRLRDGVSHAAQFADQRVASDANTLEAVACVENGGDVFVLKLDQCGTVGHFCSPVRMGTIALTQNDIGRIALDVNE